jgi:hypothetical protein
MYFVASSIQVCQLECLIHLMRRSLSMDRFIQLDNQGPPLPGSVLWRAAAGKHHHTRDSESAELPQQYTLLVHPSQRLHGKKSPTDFRSKECVARFIR